ncbi:MAG TPA: hypothetical protein VGM94_02340 [Galbitalea sp.]
MRVHQYTEGEVRSFDVEPTERLSDHLVFAEESILFLVSEEGQPVAVDVRFEEVILGGSGAFVTHKHPTIEVVVHYQGRAVQFEVSPGTRVDSVRERAIRDFSIDATDAADIGIRVLGATEDLDPSLPIGHVVHAHHKIELELVAMVHPQG